MCGLYGFVNYSGEKMKNLSGLTNALAEESAIRGTDATGIAFCSSSGINVLKESKSAYRLKFKHSDEVSSLTGHTRHSTQGSEKHNYNNHPFLGKCKNMNFALSHNGVLSNDRTLRREHSLPKTKIETDSYIAVQLIESQDNLDFDSIKYMAEKTEGSFSYTILDDENNVWIVKGDSPVSILHFPKLKIYVYASTDEILYKALIDYSSTFSSLKKGEVEEIKIDDGEILKIKPDGTLEKKTFEYHHYYGRGWWEYDFFSKGKSDDKKSAYTESDYLDDLKYIASSQGYTPDDIDGLINSGFTCEEIEEYLYFGGEM